MRCLACDCVLTDFEATRKWTRTGEYVDMCDICFNGLHTTLAEVEERDDLRDHEELPDDFIVDMNDFWGGSDIED